MWHALRPCFDPSHSEATYLCHPPAPPGAAQAAGDVRAGPPTAPHDASVAAARLVRSHPAQRQRAYYCCRCRRSPRLAAHIAMVTALEGQHRPRMALPPVMMIRSRPPPVPSPMGGLRCRRGKARHAGSDAWRRARPTSPRLRLPRSTPAHRVPARRHAPMRSLPQRSRRRLPRARARRQTPPRARHSARSSSRHSAGHARVESSRAEGRPAPALLLPPPVPAARYLGCARCPPPHTATALATASGTCWRPLQRRLRGCAAHSMASPLLQAATRQPSPPRMRSCRRTAACASASVAQRSRRRSLRCRRHRGKCHLRHRIARQAEHRRTASRLQAALATQRWTRRRLLSNRRPLPSAAPPLPCNRRLRCNRRRPADRLAAAAT